MSFGGREKLTYFMNTFVDLCISVIWICSREVIFIQASVPAAPPQCGLEETEDVKRRASVAIVAWTQLRSWVYMLTLKKLK